MRTNLFLNLNSGQNNLQKRVSHSCCKSSLLWKKKICSWTGSSKNKMTLMARDLGCGRCRCKSLSSGEREGTWSHRVSNVWLVRGTGSSSAWLEHHFHKNGRNHWKGRLGPWCIHGTAGTEQGTCLRPNCCPLGAYSYNNTRWNKHHNVQNAKCWRI